MSDALERVREVLADRDATYPHPDYDKEPLDAFQLDWADLRAVCADLTALRGARSWERWAVDNGHGEVHDTFTTKDEAKHYLWNPGERVIRVRITEIPEDGQ